MACTSRRPAGQEKEQQPHSMQVIMSRDWRASTSWRSTACSSLVGIRCMGHAATHRPQRMQAVGWRRWASRWSKAKMALFCFKMGSSSLVMATPIMGPPIISFLGSAL